MHRQDIQIAFYKNTLVLTRNLVLGEIYSIKRLALDIDLGLLRIDVFRELRVFVQRPSSESYDAAACRMDREHGPVAEIVDNPAVLILLAQTGIEKILLLISSRTGLLQERRPVGRGPAQTIFPYGLVRKPAAAEILISYGLSLIRGP